MRFFDLFNLILENLARRKARVALTAIGVVIGCGAVVVLVSLGIGLQQSATENLYGIGDLTIIQVHPKYGEPIAIEGSRPGPPGPQYMTAITDQTIADLAALEGVGKVVPRDFLQGNAILSFNRLEAYPMTFGMNLTDLGELGWSAQQGTLVLERGQAVVGALFANNFIDPRPRPGQEAPPSPDLLGQTLKLILIKGDTQGNEIRKNVQIQVVGVIAQRADEADWAIHMTMDDVNAFNEWFTGRRTNRAVTGYNSALVKVADPKQTIPVYERILDMGYEAYTLAPYLEGVNSFYLVLQLMFGGVGAIALLVAAIGIANTMTMAILERTREIGLMKALGATNRDVLAIFLGEAAGIGLLGGVGGVLAGWSAGQILNVLALAYMAGQYSQQGGPPPSNIAVVTPFWLLGFALVFSALVGLISGIYPALRAATLVPVVALKYE